MVVRCQGLVQRIAQQLRCVQENSVTTEFAAGIRSGNTANVSRIIVNAHLLGLTQHWK